MIQNDKAEPKSAWEVKRKIRVSVALATAADAKTVEQALRDLDGVLQVSAVRTRRTIGVRYLVTKTDYRALERTLEAAGFPPAAGRRARFRSGYCQNLDLTGRENARARPSACCNKPPTR
jgi:hypothetical protein